jgi:hypothetical protein
MVIVLANSEMSKFVEKYKNGIILEEFTSATCPPCVPVGIMLKDVIMPSKNVVSVRFPDNESKMFENLVRYQ